MNPALSDCCNAASASLLIDDSAHPGHAFGECSCCHRTAIYRVPVVRRKRKPEPTLWVAAGLLLGLVSAGLLHGGNWVIGILGVLAAIACWVRAYFLQS